MEELGKACHLAHEDVLLGAEEEGLGHAAPNVVLKQEAAGEGGRLLRRLLVVGNDVERPPVSWVARYIQILHTRRETESEQVV